MENASVVLQVRISQIMKTELKMQADRYGLSMSQYIRALLLSDVRQAASERQARGESSRAAAGGDGKSGGRGQD